MLVNVCFRENTTLTIEAGVTLLFKPGRGIRIRGMCAVLLIVIECVINSRIHY